MCEGFAEDVPVTESTTQQRPKRLIDWSHNFVPSVQGKYDKLNLSEFVAGFLVMIKTYVVQLKVVFLAHLELLMIKAYSWSSVRAFHKFVAKQVEQRCLEWQDSKAINDQAATFFSPFGPSLCFAYRGPASSFAH